MCVFGPFAVGMFDPYVIISAIGNTTIALHRIVIFNGSYPAIGRGGNFIGAGSVYGTISILPRGQ